MTARDSVIKRMKDASACVQAITWLETLPKNISRKDIWHSCPDQAWQESYFQEVASASMMKKYTAIREASHKRWSSAYDAATKKRAAAMRRNPNSATALKKYDAAMQLAFDRENSEVLAAMTTLLGFDK